MKKLMIALAAVAFAAVSQAAVVNWQVGFLNGPGTGGAGWGSDPIGATVTAQLLVSESVTGDATSGYTLGTLIAFTDGDAMGLGDIDGGYGWATTSDSLTDGAIYYAQVILKSGDSTLESQIVQIETAAMTGSADPAFAIASEMANVSALSGQSFDATYGTFSASGWQSVPEPTSGLLMLLGVAGLALRRKRA